VPRRLLVPLTGVFLSFALGVGAQTVEPHAPPAPPVHSFWDTTNLCLFTGVGASRGLDYASTLHFRARGFNEVLLTNSIVDDRPLFVSIEIAGTALSIGVSHWLHTHGHHRLERAVSVVHIGVTTFGAVRNYNLGKR
jgi:hypothetical protein